MELREFISSALNEIVMGIKDSQDKLSSEGIVICPKNVKDGAANLNDRFSSIHQVSEVDFDVSVTVEDATTSSANAGAQVLSVFSLGMKRCDTDKSVEVSRVKFSVPIVYPASDYK
ncbi:hypothetical protein L4D18_21725 [Vibrio campbellii]|uniref:hypothetical protein n=1 Tax=Vibrio campbellii TaxID=680 RepID=UPI003D0DC16B